MHPQSPNAHPAHANSTVPTQTQSIPATPPIPPTVLLVGHCGPDTSYLKMAVKRALPAAAIHLIHDDEGIAHHLTLNPAALLLINRVLEPGFESESGIELIALLKPRHTQARLMLVSNYPEAQQAAIQLGALPGFGKSDISSPKLPLLLHEAIK